MNILNISAADVRNAAGVVPYDLHNEFNKIAKSKLLVKKTLLKEANIYSYEDPKFTESIISRIKNKLSFKSEPSVKTLPDYYFFDYNSGKSVVSVPRILEIEHSPNIIIAYFLKNFVSLHDLLELQKITGAHVCLYLMDMAFMTGGCHYSWDCRGYLNDCSNCPAFVNESDRFIAKQNLLHSKFLVDQMDLTVLVGSEQLLRQTELSLLFKSKPVHKVLIGIDRQIFYRMGKSEIRNKYGLAKDKFIIMIGAVGQNEKRKGIRYFLDAINIVKSIADTSNVIILSVGGGELGDLDGLDVVKMGFVKQMEKLAEMFNIADLFVSPSVQDSGPMMINQSISCGTPVISFPIGVSSDIVIHGETGLIVDKIDAKLLANSMLRMINMTDGDLQIMSDNCVNLASEKLDPHKQAEKILDIVK